MYRLLRNSRMTLPQGQIFWREVGDGAAVVFLHGAWSDSSQWLEVVSSLSQEYHCFAPDLLGFGESAHPKIHYSIELQVECLAQYLEALGLRQVYLVGHSLGGWIAASFALKYLDQVRGLVLLAPEGVAAVGVNRRFVREKWLLLMPKVIFRVLRSLSLLTKILGLDFKIEQANRHRQQLLYSSTACKLLFQRRKPEIAAELLQEKLPWLKIPVLILQGGQDTSDAIALSHAYAAKLPTAQLKILSQGGSDLPQALSDALAQHIREFINFEAGGSPGR